MWEKVVFKLHSGKFVHFSMVLYHSEHCNPGVILALSCVVQAFCGIHFKQVCPICKADNGNAPKKGVSRAWNRLYQKTKKM